MKAWLRALCVCAFAIPTLFLSVLPALAQHGFARRAAYIEESFVDQDDGYEGSISGYILNTRSQLVLLACFMFPMLLYAYQISDTGTVPEAVAVVGLVVSFFAFLCVPITHGGLAHFLTVVPLAAFAVLYTGLLVYDTSRRSKTVSKPFVALYALLLLSILAFALTKPVIEDLLKVSHPYGNLWLTETLVFTFFLAVVPVYYLGGYRAQMGS